MERPLERSQEFIRIALCDIPLQTFEFLIPDFSVQPWIEAGYSTLREIPEAIKHKDRFKMLQIQHLLHTINSNTIALDKEIWELYHEDYS